MSSAVAVISALKLDYNMLYSEFSKLMTCTFFEYVPITLPKEMYIFVLYNILLKVLQQGHNVTKTTCKAPRSVSNISPAWLCTLIYIVYMYRYIINHNVGYFCQAKLTLKELITAAANDIDKIKIA